MWKANGRTDGRRTLTHDKSSHGLWPGELKMWLGFLIYSQKLFSFINGAFPCDTVQFYGAICPIKHWNYAVKIILNYMYFVIIYGRNRFFLFGKNMTFEYVSPPFLYDRSTWVRIEFPVLVKDINITKGVNLKNFIVKLDWWERTFWSSDITEVEGIK
jgi:hypothetical protein